MCWCHRLHNGHCPLGHGYDVPFRVVIRDRQPVVISRVVMALHAALHVLPLTGTGKFVASHQIAATEDIFLVFVSLFRA